jgi:methyl-accepting chemotaxis protein
MTDSDNHQQEVLSRIKEILFGDELQGLDTRLDGLRKEMMAVVENRVETLEEKFSAWQKAFDEKIESLQKQIASEAEKSNELNTGLQEIASRLDEVVKQAGKQHEENQAALLALKEEWKKAIQELEKDKVNKTEIAELFGLMIQKLK